MATYKSYSGIQSQAATYTLEEDEDEDLELEYTGPTTIPASSTLSLNTTDFIVKSNGSAVTATVESCTPSTIILSGKHIVTCTVKYKDKTKYLTTTISTTKESTE